MSGRWNSAWSATSSSPWATTASEFGLPLLAASARSHASWVERKLLIGKALFIYWPHSWHKVTLWGHDIPFPYFPNFQKMGLVR